MRAILLAILALSISGCITSAKVRDSGGPGISEVLERLPNGDRPRIAIAPVIDKSGSSGDYSLAWQLAQLSGDGESVATPENVTLGIHDMLIDAFFSTDLVTVVEREGLDEVLVEQDFSNSELSSETTQIPLAQLEGADLLVMAAITGFDAGAGGAGGFPIPIPVGRHGGFAIFNLQYKRSFISMDIRVVDTTTGRVVATAAVRGKDRDFGVEVGYWDRHSDIGRINLPGLLSIFKNTPIEKAMRKMIDEAVDHITDDM